jgi:short-subunit dehydrogenase/MoaA/NifB/PqqE/SkfB family radical SAM enzyme
MGRARRGAADWRGRRILLTGATGGIGAALAERLAAAGAVLLLSGRDGDALAELAQRLEQAGGARAALLPADLARPEEVARLADEALGLGPVDVLVNNAGVGYFALVEEATDERVRQLFEVNTLAPLALARRLAPHLLERGGRIVNILSCSGRVPVPTTGIYGGAKSAHAIIANTMRLELAPRGVHVINVYPGTVDSGFDDNALQESGRPGVCLSGGCGRPVGEVADRVVAAMSGGPGEVWLDRRGRWLAAAAILWPRLVDRFVTRLRDWALARPVDQVPHEERRWRLWQVESSVACSLDCVMCPWKEERCRAADGLMPAETWAAIRPHLPQIASIDFTGGGEPLLHPQLFDWIGEAKAAGCRVGFLTNGSGLNEEACRAIVAQGVDWIAVSIDGATAEVYEAIRRGADFEQVCEGVRRLAALRRGGRPRLMINFVAMPQNLHQLVDMVDLASRLGVDVLNIKQADVVRGEHGRGFALFASEAERERRSFERAVTAARRRARSLGVEVESVGAAPEEQPVCEQDPRTSLFVRHDGAIAPCINQAYGGPTQFLGRDETMPELHWGRLPDDDIDEVWQRPACAAMRERFAARVEAYEGALSHAGFEHSPLALEQTLRDAREQMPPAPDGCRVCHYLHGL